MKNKIRAYFIIFLTVLVVFGNAVPTFALSILYINGFNHNVSNTPAVNKNDLNVDDYVSRAGINFSVLTKAKTYDTANKALEMKFTTALSSGNDPYLRVYNVLNAKDNISVFSMQYWADTAQPNAELAVFIQNLAQSVNFDLLRISRVNGNIYFRVNVANGNSFTGFASGDYLVKPTGNANTSFFKNNSWNTILVVVDQVANSSTYYINGEKITAVRPNGKTLDSEIVDVSNGFQFTQTIKNITSGTTAFGTSVDGNSPIFRLMYQSSNLTPTDYIDDFKIYRKQNLTTNVSPAPSGNVTAVANDKISLTFNNDMVYSAFTPDNITLNKNGTPIPLNQSDITFGNIGDGANGATTVNIAIPGGFDNTKEYTLSLGGNIKDVFGQAPTVTAYTYTGSNYVVAPSVTCVSAINYSYTDSTPVTGLISGKTLTVSAEVTYAESLPGNPAVIGALYNNHNQLIALDIKPLSFAAAGAHTCQPMTFAIGADAYIFKLIAVDGIDNLKPLNPIDEAEFTQILNAE